MRTTKNVVIGCAINATKALKAHENDVQIFLDNVYQKLYLSSLQNILNFSVEQYKSRLSLNLLSIVIQYRPS
ncbi:hypothetical protein MSP8887_01065 [Marinomonas spartinae]|nr:hypothetical protein MSP8887_01065 [Marinomonas spartinae]